MNKKAHSARDKIAIVMESFTTDTSIAELCRKHGIPERTFYLWRKKFVEAGKQSLVESNDKNSTAALQKESDDLKKKIEEIAFANAVLKKNMEVSKK